VACTDDRASLKGLGEFLTQLLNDHVTLAHYLGGHERVYRILTILN
jgi:hypothetical protein